jgi:hypothetical protein
VPPTKPFETAIFEKELMLCQKHYNVHYRDRMRKFAVVGVSPKKRSVLWHKTCGYIDELLVPVRNNINLAGETAISAGRFGCHHTQTRRPPPA